MGVGGAPPAARHNGHNLYLPLALRSFPLCAVADELHTARPHCAEHYERQALFKRFVRPTKNESTNWICEYKEGAASSSRDSSSRGPLRAGLLLVELRVVDHRGRIQMGLDSNAVTAFSGRK